ncbi:FtsJ-domain-containing protein [Sistotremastrum niveocremeum HHB9708]|uniref:FtsJ-domain-containing protein n=1 Tax=Sistotremastrum niveocremeum HHB9708 TaxID=1314777 RepID=A0A164XE67_9AGAM|nr:FtsJ-domain-containing protein [Sistotremastrum niveocremeum HHB9708]
MAKGQKKTGKGRLDKYYKLAKEQGYRARSAFKLIQLNKKYSFLESARCCIDLCAAPGGWLQVASKYMPANSIIVGVDLVPIKPIPRVATFACDITTPNCRNLIRGELKDWKADVVLHDGAPNVGTAWVQDAYSQVELVLMSLKLAVEFLVKGGTFVTKVFRSADYNNLLWVFNQLFGKVEATKPPSSRNVSAEIFVVCRDFIAPKHIDPKFLDPRYVFKELTAGDSIDKGSSLNNAHANIFQPDKKRRARDGYNEGDYTLFKKVGAEAFVEGDDPVGLLGTVNQIAFETEKEKEWLASEVTSEDVKANFRDLKVLGKGDFKALLKWRTALREEIGLDVKSKPTEELTETVEITEEVDEEQQIQEELERLNAEASARNKRERRRQNEQKTRTIQRMQLQMTAPLDIGLEQDDPTLRLGGQDDIFDLGMADKEMKRRRKEKFLTADDTLSDDSDSDAEDSGSDDEAMDIDADEERQRKVDAMEAEMDGMYDAYRERMAERDAKFKVKEARQKNKLREEEWTGIKSDNSDEDDESDEGGWDVTQSAKARAGEESSDSDSDGGSDEEEIDRDDADHPNAQSAIAGTKRKRVGNQERSGSKPVASNKLPRLMTSLERSEPKSGSKAAQLWFSQNIFEGIDDEVEDEEEGSADEWENESDLGDSATGQAEDTAADDDSDIDYEVVPADADEDVEMWDEADENVDDLKRAHIKKYGLVTAEAMTLAQQLVNRQKTKTEMINDGFNRYSLNSKENLPSWFLDDEAKNYKPNIPITKEAVAAIRAKQRMLDARPIKKIAEAKARKKFKAAQQYEKAMKKAEGVNSNTDISERDKAAQIEKLMRKGVAKGKGGKREVKLVVAKGAHKGVKGRPKGVKGRYTMVDSRMKKELRAKKKKEKETKKKRR